MRPPTRLLQVCLRFLLELSLDRTGVPLLKTVSCRCASQAKHILFRTKATVYFSNIIDVWRFHFSEKHGRCLIADIIMAFVYNFLKRFFIGCSNDVVLFCFIHIFQLLISFVIIVDANMCEYVSVCLCDRAKDIGYAHAYMEMNEVTYANRPMYIHEHDCIRKRRYINHLFPCAAFT